MLAFSPAEVTAIAALFHVTALAPGLACALAADGLALSTLVRPLGPRGLKVLRWLHNAILVSLIFMWLSGLTMIAVKLLPTGPGMSPKLMAKLMAVALLSLNALAIGRIALPQLRAATGQTFDAFPTALRLKLGVIGGVSSACWLSALALGGLAVMKPMGYGALAATLLPIFALGTLGGLAVALVAPKIGALAQARAPQPAPSN